MKYTLTIDKPTEKISALLNLIRSYDEITLEEEVDDFHISDEHKNIVRERIKASEKNPDLLLDWEKVKNEFNL